MSDTLFYFFAALTLAAALLAAACRNPVNSAVAMLAALLGVAANFFLLQAPFLGVLQVLVYAGAVMVLFVFVITLLDVPRMGARKLSFGALGAGIFALLIVGAALLWLVWTPGHLPEPPHGSTGLRPATQPAPLSPPQAQAQAPTGGHAGPPLHADAPAADDDNAAFPAAALPKPTAAAPYASGAKAYGLLLFSKYMLPTLATAFLLLCAMLGVFLLAGKERRPNSQTNE